MGQFDKLTDGEYMRLVALCNAVKRVKNLVNDDVYWSFVGELGSATYFSAGLPEPVEKALIERDGFPLGRVAANALHVKRLADTGYISLSPLTQDFSYVQFLLTPRGVDYVKYRSRWGVVRWFIDLWHDLRTEVVSAIVSAIISIVVSIVTAYLLLQFQLR